jgi:threonyl-tRNA synthetase
MSGNGVKLSATQRFSVLDLPSSKVDHVAKAKASQAGRDKQRANQESGARQSASSAGLLGGPFTPSSDLSRYEERTAVFERLWAAKQAELQALPDTPISITMPDGTVKSGMAFKTTPLDIATAISKGLAEAVVIAKVLYTSRLEEDKIVACDEEEEGGEGAAASGQEAGDGELWDLNRPLIGNCQLKLLKYEDPESQTVFWHSSAHVLGAAIEATFGAHLTIGPPLSSGFYYDSYMGDRSIADEDLKKIEDKASDVCKKKFPFQRLVLSKAQALEMFASNPFKVSLITNKVPEGSLTTVYKCGPLIDLCMGPHLPNTGKIKAFAATKSSATNWLGQVTNDPLQRVYGIAFPDKAMLKQWQEFQEQAKQRDHRTVGTRQELFFFHQLSPGSCFWLPHGARVYNKLIEFIRGEYWRRGFQEVITPNIFNLQVSSLSLSLSLSFFGDVSVVLSLIPCHPRPPFHHAKTSSFGK